MTNTHPAAIQKRKFSVKFKHGNGKSDNETVVVARDEEEAFERGLKKIFGRKAWWWSDSGLAGFGQVARRLPDQPNCHTTLTGRVWFVVEPIAKQQ